MLKKGSKLLCLEDLIDPERLLQIQAEFPNWIEQKKEYTVRNIYIQHNEKENTQLVSVVLEEIRNPPIWIEQYQAWLEPGFDLKRFALIVDKPPTMDVGFSAN